MSKSTKSGGSGDEKNLYLKRLKTANAPPKVADVNLTVKQSENSRSSASAKNKRASTALSKQQLKSKIPSPANPKGASITPTSVMMSTQSSNRGEKRVPSPAVFTTVKSAMKDHQDVPEVIGQSKMSKKDGAKAKIKNDETDSKDKDKKIEESEQPLLSTNGTPTEPTVVPDELTIEYSDKDTTESVVFILAVTPEVGEDNAKQAKTTESETGDNKELEDEKESEFKLQVPTLEIEEIVEKVVIEERELTVEIKKKVEDPLIETNVVESTTSDASPVKEPPQQQKELAVDQAQNDGSFISYDANIMLKDVQIKLNDCLRDNSKAIDAVDPNVRISDNFKDRSFGCTLRGISGRSSLGRMKNITVREKKSSPNDSLFVNISSMSYDLDPSRFTPEGSPCHNGSRLDRKRKIIAEHSASTKKAKIEEGSSFLNTSLEYLRNLRKPVQVSTPNHGYKFDLGEKMSVDEQAVAAEEVSEPKKWCVVM